MIKHKKYNKDCLKTRCCLGTICPENTTCQAFILAAKENSLSGKTWVAEPAGVDPDPDQKFKRKPDSDPAVKKKKLGS